jgi:hypothetical protein
MKKYDVIVQPAATGSIMVLLKPGSATVILARTDHKGATSCVYNQRIDENIYPGKQLDTNNHCQNPSDLECTHLRDELFCCQGVVTYGLSRV